MLSKITSHKHYGLLGLLLIVISFIHWYLPFTNLNLAFSHGIFWLGNILLFDSISYELSGVSLIKITAKSRMKHFLLLGLICGALIEEIPARLGKIWYYPQWDFLGYVVFLGLGFGFYFFYLIETYLGFKAILLHFFKKHQRKEENFKKLKKIFLIEGFVGAVGIGAGVTYLILKTISDGTLQTFFDTNKNIITSESLWIPTVAILFFLFLFLEYLEYERHEKSLTYDLVKGNFVPLISIIIAAFISGVIYEGFVVPSGLWKYTNFPLEENFILGVPIIIILLWPFQYFPLLALYRVLFKKETEQIWK